MKEMIRDSHLVGIIHEEGWDYFDIPNQIQPRFPVCATPGDRAKGGKRHEK